MDLERTRRPGFGTWQLSDPEVCATCVAHAIDHGYRHIDTAVNYGNEEDVGTGIERSSVTRDELFVATKLPTGDLDAISVKPTTVASLERLGLDRVDLLYVHWPIRTYVADETLPAMAELVDEGIVDALGVSNFTPELLDEAMSIAGDVIIAHQYEKHPYLPNREVHTTSREHGLTSVAYSPLARGHVLDDPVIAEIAETNEVTPAQVTLAWLMHDEDVTPIPKSGRHSRIEENFAAREVSLTGDDISRIDAIDKRERVVDTNEAPWRQ